MTSIVTQTTNEGNYMRFMHIPCKLGAIEAQFVMGSCALILYPSPQNQWRADPTCNPCKESNNGPLQL